MIARYCLLGHGRSYDQRSYHRNKFMNMINPCPYVTQALTALRDESSYHGPERVRLCRSIHTKLTKEGDQLCYDIIIVLSQKLRSMAWIPYKL